MNWRTCLVVLAAGGLLAGCNKSSDKPNAVQKAKVAETVAEPAGPDVSKLAAALKNTRPERLQIAIDIAVQLDAQGENPIPTLLEALKDPNAGALGETSTEKPYSAREAAVLALLKLGQKGRTALINDGLKVLKEGLKDAKPTVKEHTANAFAMTGMDAKPYAEDIAQLASSKEQAVRSAAYRALEKSKAPASPAVLKLLLNDDVGISTDAAASLAVNKPAGPAAAPALVAALKRTAPEGYSADQLAYVKNRAAEALAGLGKDAEAAIPELLELVLKTTVEDVEKMTRPRKANERGTPASGPVLALRRIGRPAIPAVLPLLKNEQAIVRYQAALVFGGMNLGPLSDEAKAVVTEVQGALKAERNLPTGQFYVFEELLQSSIRLGADSDLMVKQLLELLADDDKDVRRRAVRLFSYLGAKAAPAVPKLQELLNDPEPSAKIAVLDVLRGIGPGAKAAAADVGKLAEAKEEDVARAAVQTLKVIGSAQASAVPTLVKLLASNDRNVVIEAANALATAGPAAEAAVEPITKLLGDANTHFEERAALLAALAGIGPTAKAATPTVSTLTADRDPPTRTAAVACLGKISAYDAAVGKLFAERLKDTSPNVRIATLKAFAAYGPKAAAGAPDIKAMMDGTKAVDLKVWSAAALVAMGIDADKNAGIVLENLKPKAPARLAAMDCLILLGDKAKAGVPDLLDAVRDKTPAPKNGVSVRQKAVTVCGQLPKLTKQAVSPITDLLKDGDLQLRKVAADALGAYGPEAIVAVPKLREAAEADDDALREAAKAALEKIVPGKKTEEGT